MKRMTAGLIAMILLIPTISYGFSGDAGYEGGISSGYAPNKTIYEYKEVSFITGKPIVFDGTVTIKKSFKTDTKTSIDTITTSYLYSLKNLDNNATITRSIAIASNYTKKDNGQKIEEASIFGKPSETIKVGGKTYTLKTYDYTKSSIIDAKPAVEFYAGNILAKKVYQIGAGTTINPNGGNTVTIDMTSKIYGFNQCWDVVESQKTDYTITSEETKSNVTDKWNGTATVTWSSGGTNGIKYISNAPETISFDGGYIYNQKNNSVLEYTSSFPEMDSKGVATDFTLVKQGNYSLESFPVSKRLRVDDLKQLKGHWAEKDISQLYALEIFTSNPSNMNPEQLITREEFIDAMIRAAKDIPIDPVILAAMKKSTTLATTTTTSTFIDVEINDPYLKSIEAAFKRGFAKGKGNMRFGPSDYLTFSEAAKIMINSIGLENMSKWENSVTTFKDDGEIPTYARNSINVAQKIGLINGDDEGNIKPNSNLTKARTAALINKFIKYMAEGMRRDYKEGLLKY